MGSHLTHAAPPKLHAVGERELHVGPEQHPVAHVCEQPVHAPPLHISPAGQLAHADPPLPHAPTSLPVSHCCALLQQPVGHDVGSHTQVPFRHRFPVAHALPVPHMHAPPTQPSDDPAVHGEQVRPPVPQAVTDGGVHVWFVSQQPLAQDAASHTHWPPEQTWPGPHSALMPHRQAPCCEQLSAAAPAHEKHVEPAAPQFAGDRT
jgi:hypothetical protein